MLAVGQPALPTGGPLLKGRDEAVLWFSTPPSPRPRSLHKSLGAGAWWLGIDQMHEEDREYSCGKPENHVHSHRNHPLERSDVTHCLKKTPDLDKEVITFITENDISRYGMAY